MAWAIWISIGLRPYFTVFPFFCPKIDTVQTPDYPILINGLSNYIIGSALYGYNNLLKNMLYSTLAYKAEKTLKILFLDIMISLDSSIFSWHVASLHLSFSKSGHWSALMQPLVNSCHTSSTALCIFPAVKKSSLVTVLYHHCLPVSNQ